VNEQDNTMKTRAQRIRELVAGNREAFRAHCRNFYQDYLRWKEENDAREEKRRRQKREDAIRREQLVRSCVLDLLQLPTGYKDQRNVELTEYMFGKHNDSFTDAQRLDAEFVKATVLHDKFFAHSSTPAISENIWSSDHDFKTEVDALWQEMLANWDNWAVEIDSALNRINEQGAAEDGKPEATEQFPYKNQVPWNENDTDYIPASDAIVEYTDSKLPMATLSKKLRPDGGIPVHYMRKGKRCRVHIGDFRKWANDEYMPEEKQGKITETYLADIEKRKNQERGKTSGK